MDALNVNDAALNRPTCGSRYKPRRRVLRDNLYRTLDYLASVGKGVTRADIVADSGGSARQQANTLRITLMLERCGLIVRQAATHNGRRGRPKVHYSITDKGRNWLENYREQYGTT